MTSTRKVRTLSKVFLSLWIVYNIFTMLVMPNAGAFLGRLAAPLITPYANTVGLNASWNFFSPDPAHTMYIRYFVSFLNAQGQEEKESVEGYFPQEKDHGIKSPLRQRELYAMRFMVIDSKRLRLLMGPWLCKQYPGATNVDMTFIIETVPFLDRAAESQGKSLSDLSEELKYLRESYSCNGGMDEEAL